MRPLHAYVGAVVPRSCSVVRPAYTGGVSSPVAGLCVIDGPAIAPRTQDDVENLRIAAACCVSSVKVQANDDKESSCVEGAPAQTRIVVPSRLHGAFCLFTVFRLQISDATHIRLVDGLQTLE